MSSEYNLQRFVQAQERDYPTALREIKSGAKRSHWMWYIFPQLHGLGHSEMAQRYAIKNLKEATEYLLHPVLGKRLIEISEALLVLPENNATKIMGSPDDMKLRSSMTLFSLVPGAETVFKAVLTKFFASGPDAATIRLLQ